MTEDEREAHRQARRDWWTDERREERRAVAKAQYDAWAAEHPDRAAFVIETWQPIKDGTLERPGCEVCHEPANPVYDWDSLTVTAWRCKRHRHPTDEAMGPL